jgi:hypothetical protein
MPRSSCDTGGVRRPALTALLAVALLPGCGGGEVAEIGPLRADVYVPPPEVQAARPEAVAAAPRSAAAPAAGEGPPSDAQVRAALEEAFGTDDAEALVDAASLRPDGLATVPPAAPAKVARIIRAGNEVARKPYVYGGGHGRLAGETFIDTAYDCSGSMSFGFAAAGLLDRPMVSGEFAKWGKPGPGKWVTIYANDGHAFMVVAGLRFDTSGRQRTGSRWQTASRGTGGFTVRHPPGL